MQNTKVKTTADLRETLFQCIEDVKSGKLQPAQAKQIASMAQTITKTAELEIQFALAQDKLDGTDNKLDIGPLALTGPEPTKLEGPKK